MPIEKLTPTAQLTLDALQHGPGNVHELAERTGRSRSATDKALNDLAKAALIVKVDNVGDSADGAPARWQLANPAATDGDADTEPGTPDQTDAAGQPADTAAPNDETQSPSGIDAPNAGDETDAAPEADAAPQDGTTPLPDEQADGEAVSGRNQAEAPKLCRGCQAQMPKVCEHCWQKTPAYCGNCRRTMPQVRRGEPGEPVILSNGLPKLRPGELEALVEQVMREQPLPAFAGVTGWTAGRVAVHLPGRSSGAIKNALDKLSTIGKAELIGDNPMRYQLKPTDQPDTATAEAAPPQPGTGES